MRATEERIRIAAYHLWSRRGRIHGRDLSDWHDAQALLAFELNYQTIADHALGAPRYVVVDEQSVRRCRFCERSAGEVAMSAPRPLIAGIPVATTLVTALVCDECHVESLEPLAHDLRRFWSALDRRWAEGTPVHPQLFSVSAYKALVAAALLILPDAEVPAFADTFEWLINLDHAYDASLFAGTYCRVSQPSTAMAGPSIRLARRTDDDAPHPYMLCVIAAGGIAVQLPLPLCSHDQDLDGRAISMPTDPRIASALVFDLPLSIPHRPARRHGAVRSITYESLV